MQAATRRYLLTIAIFILAMAAVLVLRPWAQTGSGGQSELWAIASRLHAPGDTTTQTAATSTVSSAWQIRAQIQQLLDKGMSERAILQVMEQDYGPTILANPAFSGFGALAWLLPGAGVAAALAIYGLFLRRQSGRTVLNDTALNRENPAEGGQVRAQSMSGPDKMRNAPDGGARAGYPEGERPNGWRAYL
jgi:cytochrome c-type biogenesis protein CcmH/NrfF